MFVGTLRCDRGPATTPRFILFAIESKDAGGNPVECGARCNVAGHSRPAVIIELAVEECDRDGQRNCLLHSLR